MHSTGDEITIRIRRLRKQFRYDLEALLDESAHAGSEAAQGLFEHRLAELHRQFDRQVAEVLQTARTDEVYHVTRRFDLVHILGITAGFAVLFALLRALGVQPLTLGLISGLVAVVGVAQALFPDLPRASSMLAGLAYGMVLALIGIFADGRESLLCSAVVFGPVAGYLAGLLAAAVFLVVDGSRRFIRECKMDRYVHAAADDDVP